MMSAFYGILAGLIGVVPWLMQGIALVMLRRQRSGAWWVMVAGTTLQILARIGMSVVMVLFSPASRAPGGSFTALARYNLMTGWVGMGGGAMFAAGFVWFCLKRRAAGEREQQLEAMTAAMAEELRVLRERVGQ
jgi:hypothetical protein